VMVVIRVAGRGMLVRGELREAQHDVVRGVHADADVVVPLAAVGRGRGRVLDAAALDERAERGAAGADLGPLRGAVRLRARGEAHRLGVPDEATVAWRGAIDGRRAELGVLRLER